jgi:photosystem II stability/assembly factor-like uncharacterized protein
MEMLMRQLTGISLIGRLFLCAAPRAGDLNADGLVDWLDLLELGCHWLSPEGAGPDDTWEWADANGDGVVDGADFALLSENWRIPPTGKPAVGWERIDTGFNYILMDIEFPEGQSRIGYAVGESLTYRGEGIVIKTTDRGNTWTRLNPEGIPGLEAMSSVDLQTGYARGWGDSVMTTTDGGITWETVAVVDDMLVVTDIEFKDPNYGVLFEGGNVYVTEDGGWTWNAGTGITRVCHEVTWASEDTLFAVGNDNYVFASTDGGYTWATAHTGRLQELLLGVDFLTPDYGIAVGDYSTVLRTIDGGKTWSRVSFPGDMLLKSVFILDADVAYLCGTPEYVFKTTDGGATWISDYEGNWERAFNRIWFTDDGTGFICGSGGILLRKAGRGIVPERNGYE